MLLISGRYSHFSLIHLFDGILGCLISVKPILAAPLSTPLLKLARENLLQAMTDESSELQGRRSAADAGWRQRFLEQIPIGDWFCYVPGLV